MDNSCGQFHPSKNQERGAARLKFILIIAVIAVIAYIGYQYVPVAYQASMFKTTMQDEVDKASATPGQTNESLRNQLRVDADKAGLPADAEITVEQGAHGGFQAHVKYTRAVTFPGYVYAYNFDHTTKSTELFGPKK